jgi:FkbM family methyltransferase
MTAIATEFAPDAVLEIGGNEQLPDPADAARVLVRCDLGIEGAVHRLLAHVLPLVAERENLIVVDGITDARRDEVDPHDTSLHWQGPLVAASPQLVPLYDFLSRNRLAFETRDHELVFSVRPGLTFPPGAGPLPEIFERFPPWEGTVEPGWLVNWLGARNRTSMQSDARSYAMPTFQRASTPELSDELFEWLDVLESVAEAGASFTMVELGAGFGRWLVNAVVALRRLDSDRPFRLVAVEAEPTHFKWIRRNLLDNAIDPSEHRLIHAAVAARDGWVKFQRGDASGWYGQAIEREDPAAKLAGPGSRLIRWSRNTAANRLAVAPGARKVRRTRAVSLATVLAPLDHVDLIHVDVQGAEAEVLEAGAAELAQKVRRVHVGTHDADNEARLRTLFATLGWTCRFDYPGKGQSLTPWGPVAFQDGVQSWDNPVLAGGDDLDGGDLDEGAG